MLVQKTKEKKVFWKFASIIMQNMSQICHCFVHQHGRLIENHQKLLSFQLLAFLNLTAKTTDNESKIINITCTSCGANNNNNNNNYYYYY